MLYVQPREKFLYDMKRSHIFRGWRMMHLGNLISSCCLKY